MALSWNEIKDRAIKFSRDTLLLFSEKSQKEKIKI